MLCFVYLAITLAIGIFLTGCILIERKYHFSRRVFRSEEDWRFEDAEVIQIFDKVGEGATADILFGRWGAANVAFKKSKSNSDVLRDEAIALRALISCPHIIRLEGVFDTPYLLLIALEYMPNGTLLQLSAKTGKSFRDERLMMRILTDVCSALVFVHARGYIHGDVAARNVMISAEWRGRLCDFGSCIALRPNEKRRYVGAPGPVRWLPPETIGTSVYTTATDIYAFGVTIWETACQRTPWEDLSLQEITISVTNGTTLPVPDAVSDVFANLMRSCFAFDPDARPSATALHESMIGFDASGSEVNDDWTYFVLPVTKAVSRYHRDAARYAIGNGTGTFGVWTSNVVEYEQTAVFIHALTLMSEELLSSYTITFRITDTPFVVPFCTGNTLENYSNPYDCPNVYVMRTPAVAALAASDDIISLDNFFQAFTLERGFVLQDDFVQSVFYAYNSGTSWKAMPISSIMTVMMYNVTAFDSIGLKHPPPYGRWDSFEWTDLASLAIDLLNVSRPSITIYTEIVNAVTLSRNNNGFLYSYDGDRKVCELDRQSALTRAYDDVLFPVLSSGAVSLGLNTHDAAGESTPDFETWLALPPDVDLLEPIPVFDTISVSFNVTNLWIMQSVQASVRDRFFNGSDAIRVARLPGSVGALTGRAATIPSGSDPLKYELAWQTILRLVDFVQDLSMLYAAPPPYISMSQNWNWTYARDALESDTLSSLSKRSVQINYPYLGFTEIEQFDLYAPFRYTWMEMIYKNASVDDSVARALDVVDFIFTPPESCAVNPYLTMIVVVVVAFTLAAAFFCPCGRDRLPPKATKMLPITFTSETLTPRNERVHEIRCDVPMGRFGNAVTYAGTHGERKCVIKSIHTESFLQEKYADKLLNVRNEYVLHWTCVFQGCSTILLVAEMQKCDLREYVRGTTPVQKQSLFIDVIKGLKYLHEKRIVHGSLSCSNVLISHQNEVKLTDYGLRAVHATPKVRWSAPETLQNGETSCRSDMYSAAITFLEMCQEGEPPWIDVATDEEVAQIVARDERPNLNFPHAEVIHARILQHCWQKSKRKRMDASRLLEALYDLRLDIDV